VKSIVEKTPKNNLKTHPKKPIIPAPLSAESNP
jgi:hypothetical protein